jgi:hypothetical protein
MAVRSREGRGGNRTPARRIPQAAGKRIDEATVKHETDRLLAPTNPQSGRVARIATDNLAVTLPGLPVNTPAGIRKAYMNILTEHINEL